MVQVAKGLKGGLVKAERTRLRLPNPHLTGNSGKILSRPFMNHTIVGCVKMEHLSTGGRGKRMVLGASRCTWITLRAKPNVFRERT